jgi:Protein of unknown function (DUF2934)
MAARAIQPRTDILSLDEQIRRRAYERYLERGREPGLEVDDWLRAEEDVRRTEEAIDEASKNSSPASDPLGFQIAG